MTRVDTRYCSSIVTSLLFSDARYWYIESALFTGLNALAPLILKLYDCMHDVRRWKYLIHDNIHCRNFSGLSQMPGKSTKAGYTSWKFFQFFYLWKNSRQNTFSGLFMVMFKKESSQRALSFNTPRLALFYENNPSSIFEVFVFSTLTGACFQVLIQYLLEGLDSRCIIHSPNVVDMLFKGRQLVNSARKSLTG